MSDYIKGQQYPNYKPSTAYSSGRICIQETCTTVISKYNKLNIVTITSLKCIHE